MLKELYKTLPVLAILVLTTPALAQSEITNNQPVRGKLNSKETRIQDKLNADFKKGLIDSDQLSQLQRDFDGILSKEDDLKTKGMTDSGRKTIDNDLAAFDARLDKSASGNRSAQKKGAAK